MSGFRDWVRESQTRTHTISIPGGHVDVQVDRQGGIVQTELAVQDGNSVLTTTRLYDASHREREVTEQTSVTQTGPDGVLNVGIPMQTTTQYDAHHRETMVDRRGEDQVRTVWTCDRHPDGSQDTKTVEYRDWGSSAGDQSPDRIETRHERRDGTWDRVVTTNDATIVSRHNADQETSVRNGHDGLTIRTQERQADGTTVTEIWSSDGTGERVTEAPTGPATTDYYSADGTAIRRTVDANGNQTEHALPDAETTHHKERGAEALDEARAQDANGNLDTLEVGHHQDHTTTDPGSTNGDTGPGLRTEPAAPATIADSFQPRGGVDDTNGQTAGSSNAAPARTPGLTDEAHGGLFVAFDAFGHSDENNDNAQTVAAASPPPVVEFVPYSPPAQPDETPQLPAAFDA